MESDTKVGKRNLKLIETLQQFEMNAERSINVLVNKKKVSRIERLVGCMQRKINMSQKGLNKEPIFKRAVQCFQSDADKQKKKMNIFLCENFQK